MHQDLSLRRGELRLLFPAESSAAEVVFWGPSQSHFTKQSHAGTFFRAINLNRYDANNAGTKQAKLHQPPAVADPPAEAFGQRPECSAAAAVQSKWDHNQIPSS